MSIPPIQSPTRIYPADILPVPVEAMQTLASGFGSADAVADAAYAFFTGDDRALPAHLLPALRQAACFTFTTLPPDEMPEAARELVNLLHSSRAARNLITHPIITGQLNADLVTHVITRRKDAPEFFHEGLSDSALSVSTAMPEHSLELQSLRERGEDGAILLTSRYLRRLLNMPGKLDAPVLGKDRMATLSYVLPKLVEVLADDRFLDQIPASERDATARTRDRIMAAVAASIPETSRWLLTEPGGFSLTFTGHGQGHASLQNRDFIDGEGYGHATGKAAITVNKTDATPDVTARGVRYIADHTHWHLGGTEHPIEGDGRDLRGELHIVHQSEAGDRFLVIGAYIEVDEKAEANAMVDSILLEAAKPHGLTASHLDFLPLRDWNEGRYHSYHGGLTTEPYSGNVDFYLLHDRTIKVTPVQYEWLTQLMQFENHRHNAREAQPYLDRAIIDVPASRQAR